MTASFRSKNIAEALTLIVAVALNGAAPLAQAQTQAQAQAPAATSDTSASARAADVVIPAGYVIGPDDVLSIVYWKDKDMSSESQVRPDGKISLPLINEITAAGLTPEELRQKITEESKRFMEDASITVVVRQINSRKVFITGEVSKPGPYPLTAPTSVMQLIAMAGGLREYANSKKIVIMRTEGGRPVSLPFDYPAVTSGKNLKQNIELKPGDTVVVP
jgi:polysaccharide export outer membrane protein